MINGYNFFNVLDIDSKLAHIEENDNLNTLKVKKMAFISKIDKI